MVTLAGGAHVLTDRALALADEGELRLACQLIEWAAQTAGDEVVHAARAHIYELRRRSEPSLMAKGIFAAAARDSAPPPQA